jgi:SepF-like predicted cell division protein (DUF552 family)
MGVLTVSKYQDLDDLIELDEKLEDLRIALADAALVDGADEKQYQILEALRILGVEFRSAAVEPGRKPIPNPESGLRYLW